MAMLTNCYICGKQIYNSTNPDYDIYEVKDINGPFIPAEKIEEFRRIKNKFPGHIECVCRDCFNKLIFYTDIIF